MSSHTPTSLTSVRLSEHASASRPEDLLDALRRTVGAHVTLHFASTQHDRFIDGSGRPVEPPAAGGIEVRREGRRIAVLHIAAAPNGSHDEPLALAPGELLLISNAALIAQRRAEIETWYDARTDIVQAQDLARAKLEQDLHDGAQQLVLSLLIELRLLEEGCEPGSPDRALAEAARAEVTHALTELRAIAHGLYPVELDRAGLVAATDLMADQLRVRIDVEGDDDLPAPVRMAVYRLVEAVAEQAATRGAERLSVNLHSDGGLVRVTVEASDGETLDPGVAGDRIVAMRGEFRAGVRLEAVLPLMISGLAPSRPPQLSTELDGTYEQLVTAAHLRAAGFTETTAPNGRPGVSEAGIPLNMLVENAGVFRHELHRGSYRWTQDQPDAEVSTSGSGYYVVDGEELVLADGRLARDGRPLVLRFRWSRRAEGVVEFVAIDEWNASRVVASSPWVPVRP